jgi:hypothetical protein
MCYLLSFYIIIFSIIISYIVSYKDIKIVTINYDSQIKNIENELDIIFTNNILISIIRKPPLYILVSNYYEDLGILYYERNKLQPYNIINVSIFNPFKNVSSIYSSNNINIILTYYQLSIMFLGHNKNDINDNKDFLLVELNLKYNVLLTSYLLGLESLFTIENEGDFAFDVDMKDRINNNNNHNNNNNNKLINYNDIILKKYYNSIDICNKNLYYSNYGDILNEINNWNFIKANILLQIGYFEISLLNNINNAIELYEYSLHYYRISLSSNIIIDSVINNNFYDDIHSRLIIAMINNKNYSNNEWINYVNIIEIDYKRYNIKFPSHVINPYWNLFAANNMIFNNTRKSFIYLEKGHEIDIKNNATKGYFYKHNLNHINDIINFFPIKNQIILNNKVNNNNILGVKSKVPIFIVGFMRSGSSLLEKLLTSHDDISTIGEESSLITGLKDILNEIKIININLNNISNNDARIINKYSQKILKLMKLKSMNNINNNNNPSKRIIDKMLFNYKNIGILLLLNLKYLI